MLESVLGLNGDEIVDLSLAVAEDSSTKTNRFLRLVFFRVKILKLPNINQIEAE